MSSPRDDIDVTYSPGKHVEEKNKEKRNRAITPNTTPTNAADGTRAFEDDDDNGVSLGLTFINEDDVSLSTIASIITEILGPTLYLFTSITYVVVEEGFGFFSTNETLHIALMFGFTIFVLVYVLGPISGGHINPMITLSFMFGKQISVIKGLFYILAQFLGSMLGVALAKFITKTEDWNLTNGGVTQTLPGYRTGQAFCGEIIMTFILCITALATLSKHHRKKSTSTEAFAPFSIGIAVFLGHMVLLNIDGCSINPARSFASSVAAPINGWDNSWVWWLGPTCGALLSTPIFVLGQKCW